MAEGRYGEAFSAAETASQEGSINRRAVLSQGHAAAQLVMHGRRATHVAIQVHQVESKDRNCDLHVVQLYIATSSIGQLLEGP